jgi:hypothetical protein
MRKRQVQCHVGRVSKKNWKRGVWGCKLLRLREIEFWSDREESAVAEENVSGNQENDR